MTEYTPTTEEVRNMYVYAWMTDLALQQADLAYESKFKDEFDRWLDDVKRNAWARGYNEGYSTAEKRCKERGNLQ